MVWESRIKRSGNHFVQRVLWLKKKKKRKKLEGLTYQRVQDGCITCWIGRLALVAEAWIQITALFLND